MSIPFCNPSRGARLTPAPPGGRPNVAGARSRLRTSRFDASHVDAQETETALQKHKNIDQQHAEKKTSSSFVCTSPAWWPQRGAPTRSHPELGRETPQRQWYFVSRRGRVGRRQACKVQTITLQIIKKISSADHPPKHLNAGWSSPVARQAHNLKVAGSNPAPATKSSKQNQKQAQSRKNTKQY